LRQFAAVRHWRSHCKPPAESARTGDKNVQLFGRSARALAISASITGSIAAWDPTFSVDTTYLPSMPEQVQPPEASPGRSAWGELPTPPAARERR